MSYPTLPGQPAKTNIGSYTGDHTAQFFNGSWAVRAKGKQIVGAWFTDYILLLALTAAIGVSFAASSDDTSVGVFVAILMWLTLPWVSGFFCIGRNSLGTLLAGTRLAKNSSRFLAQQLAHVFARGPISIGTH